MISLIPAQTGSSAMVGDLPLHPLVVHVPVVILPLSAILLILAALVPFIRRRFLGLSVIGATVGLAGVIVALVSGGALAESIGVPQEHANAADRLLFASIVMFLLSIAWWIVSRMTGRSFDPGRVSDGGASDGSAAGGSAAGSSAVPGEDHRGRGPLPLILGLVTALAAVAVLIFTVQTGHTGSQAAWSGVVAGSESSMSDSSSSDSSGSESDAAASSTGAAEGDSASYTIDEVAANDSPESCWAVIDGAVYDLTDWIGQHPGGEGAIESLCGTDGTEAFTGQHGGDEQIGERLDSFRIGELAA